MAADLEIVHPGSIEAADVMASAVDGAGCAIDYDIPSLTARVTAKGAAGANTIMKLRVLLAGVLKDAITVLSSGAVALIAPITAPVVNSGTGSASIPSGASTTVMTLPLATTMAVYLVAITMDAVSGAAAKESAFLTIGYSVNAGGSFVLISSAIAPASQITAVAVDNTGHVKVTQTTGVAQSMTATYTRIF